MFNKQNQPKYFTITLGYGVVLLGSVIFATLGFIIVEAFARW